MNMPGWHGYFTGLDAELKFTLNFSDGRSQVMVPPLAAGGLYGAQFFGFTDTGHSISSLTLTAEYTNQISPTAPDYYYAIGVDEVQVAFVPEPSSLALVGLAVLSCGFASRRRRG